MSTRFDINGDLLEDEDGSPTLQEIMLPVWANRKRIFVGSALVALVVLGINFLFQVYYKSTATLLPETEKSKLLTLGQFADVAQKLLGDNIPGSEIARLYPTVVMSETILRSVLLKKYHTERFRDSVDLVEYYGLDEATQEERMDKTLKMLKNLMTATIETKTGIFNVSVEMPEKQLAADVLNAVIAELYHFMRQKRITTASEQLKWIDVRLKEVSRDLAAAEDTLKEFGERNRLVFGSPLLQLHQERLKRDVLVKSTIFIELKKQYELAKLEEIKNITIVNVLDPGRPPVKKERPKRATNAAIAFVLTLILLSTFYSMRQLYGEKIRNTFQMVSKGREHK